MHRYIVSETWKFQDLKSLAGNCNLRIITPSKAIAANLRVPHCSLESLAQTSLKREGWKIASALKSLEVIDFWGMPNFYLPTIRELLANDIDLSALQKDKFDRVKKLANLTLKYREKLRQEHYLDAAELFWQASRLNLIRHGYLFYGYFLPRRDELAFIDKIAGDNSILVLPNCDRTAIEFLIEKGWQLGEGMREEAAEINHRSLGRQLQQSWLTKEHFALTKAVRLQTYPNLIAEVRGVLSQIGLLLDRGIAPKNIVLITRDEKLYGDALIDIGWEYGIPVRVLYEIPLSETRLGGWLQLLLEVIKTNFPFEATAKLLLHPLAKYISPEIWQEARQIHPQNLQAWQELGVDLSLLQFPAGKFAFSVWLRRLNDILENWQILEHGKRWAREIVAYYRLRDVFNELTKTTPNKIDRQTFIEKITEILALLSVPAQPGRGGVELHSPATLFGTNYQYVFVLGMAEGILPATIADDPVLDFYDRARLNKDNFLIPTATDKAQTEALSFYHLLGIAETAINFSYPQTIDNKTILPSSYIDRLGIKVTKLENLPLPSLETARQVYLHQPQKLNDALMPQIIKAWQVETRRESAAAADEYDGVIGKGINIKERVFSASQLTQLGQCPFKWFSYRLLKLKILAEAELDLNVTFRGNLYHRCLELSLAEIKTAGDLENFNREQLERAFTTAETELKLTKLPGWEQQRQEHLELIYRNTIAPEFLPINREIIDRETEFTTQWYGLQIKGKIDRLDGNDKELIVIDYKTSSNIPAGIKDDNGKANIDLQLALYTDSISNSYPEAEVTAVYYSLTKCKTLRRPVSNSETLAAFAERVKSHLETGNYPVAPDVEFQACRYCDFDLVCRKGNRLMGKNINKRA
jgi:CRISPR/Cas system-associated exonuclease Cas4 (RecB family)